MAKVVYGETVKKDIEATEPDKLFKVIDEQVRDCEGDTSEWSSTQEKYHKLRMRIKRKKTFPFVGSSNIRMPTAEINIRKIKAGIMNQLFGIRPVVQAVPTPTGNMDVATKIEKFMDHLIMDIIKIEPKAEITIDQSLEKGFYLMKPHWRVEIVDREEIVDTADMQPEEVEALMTYPVEEIMPIIIQRIDVDMDDLVADDNMEVINKVIDKIRAGKTKMTFILKDVIYDFPDIGLCSPERIYVPSDTGWDPQNATALTHEFFLPLEIIKANAKIKGWDQDVVDRLKKYRDLDSDKLTDTQKDFREGIDRMKNPSQLVRVWETYGYYDIDGKGKKKKAMVTSFPDFKEIARKVLIDSVSGKYPFVKVFYELTDDRWFSHRGIPELIEDIIKEIDVQHNMKIDQQTIRNAPMFVYRAGMVDPNLVGMIPNQAIPINGLQPLEDTIKALNLHNPNTEYSYEREQMILETKVQEMVSQIDYSLNSMINRRQPRTLGEVQEQAGGASKAFNLDVKHYLNAFSELYEMIFELWSQLGKESYEFNYFGNSTQGETIKLTREELQGKYNIKVRGNDQNTNPQIKIQKANQILAALTNPTFLQAGIIQPQNLMEGLKRYYQALDVDRWETLVSPPPPPPPPPDPKTAIQPKFSELEDTEKDQVLSTWGIQSDMKARDYKSGADDDNQKVELMEKIQKIGGGEIGKEPRSGRAGEARPELAARARNDFEG